MKVSVSFLDSDFGELNKELKKVESADFLHLDIMDGNFVDNLTYGPPVLASLKTKMKIDAHLMVTNPEKYIDFLLKHKAHMISFHVESVKDFDTIIKKIKDKKRKVGIAIRPKTPLDAITNFLNRIDYVLIMAVEPGASGQKFIYETLDKIKRLKDIIQKHRWKLQIIVDGGINEKTAKLAYEAGANIVVSSSFIYNSKNSKTAIKTLQKIE